MEDKKYRVKKAARVEAFHVSEERADELYETLQEEIKNHKVEILFDVYIVKEKKNEKILKKGDLVDLEVLNKIHNNHENIYIPSQQKSDLINYINDHISEFISKTSISSTEKSKRLYNNAINVMKDLFEKPINKETIAESKRSINKVIDGILDGNVTLSSLLEVTSYDYYTYTHSVDVAVYSVALAKYLGLDNHVIKKIGEAAILHDIGKTKIDIEILNKQGKLTQGEFEIMKNHPQYGYEILKEQGENDPYILLGALQHHEKIDGTGYPKGLTLKEINPISMIIACADIFDALTTKRSYKEPLSSFEALTIMHNQMISGLNKNILEKFIKMMGKTTI